MGWYMGAILRYTNQDDKVGKGAVYTLVFGKFNVTIIGVWKAHG
jgi:hypothetical protein